MHNMRGQLPIREGLEEILWVGPYMSCTYAYEHVSWPGFVRGMNTCNAGWTSDSLGQGLLICDLLPPGEWSWMLWKYRYLRYFSFPQRYGWRLNSFGMWCRSLLIDKGLRTFQRKSQLPPSRILQPKKDRLHRLWSGGSSSSRMSITTYQSMSYHIPEDPNIHINAFYNALKYVT